MNTKIMTMCTVYDGTRVLLGEIMKEGKLKGMYNGFGGKVEEGETPFEAAERELKEETGIIPLDMKKRGVIFFEMEEEGNPFEGKPQVELHVFSVTRFEGEPRKTREMRPQWFLHSEIPYDMMWPDDLYWLPLIFKEKNFEGRFFLKDPRTIINYTIKEVG